MSRRACFGLSALSALLVLASVAPASASGSSALNDAYAQGFVGLCDEHGHRVTHGSLARRPFVWRAVSSVPAPAGYAHGKAELYAYQPRRGVDPGNWSGSPLTFSSTFTNSSHPMAQATYVDPPLAWFVQAYPPNWNGLVELRMRFIDPTAAKDPLTYPATTLRVSGDAWRVVSGSGRVSCTSGRAVSAETRLLPRSRLPQSPLPASDTRISPVNTGPGAAVSSSPPGTSRAGDRLSASGDHATAATGQEAAAGGDGGSSGSLPWTWLGFGLVTALLVGSLGLVWARSRRPGVAGPEG
jgi:hypothetical protein